MNLLYIIIKNKNQKNKKTIKIKYKIISINRKN